MPKGQGKTTISSVMRQFKGGTLHSGSKSGPQVTKRSQAIAIAMNEARAKKK